MVFIAPQAGDFLQRTYDMDHSSIVDYNNGKEDLWFTIQKPAAMQSGAVLTVTPLPADPTTIHIKEITQDNLPNTYLGKQITSWTILENAISDMWEIIYKVLPIILVVSTAALIISLGYIVWNTIKKRPSSDRVKKVVYISSSTIFLAIIPITFLFFFGFSGSFLGISKVGLSTNMDDKVTISYITTTVEGITMQIVIAEDGKGLTNYLERNGLPKAPNNEETLSHYVNQKMNFVITHVPYESFLVSQKKYIHINFTSPNIFFPLAVNYTNNEYKHAVTILVLKPVRAKNLSTNFSDIGEDKNKHTDDSVRYEEEVAPPNKSISYFTGNDLDTNIPTKSMVYFYDKKSNYNYDVTMDIGAATSLTAGVKMMNGWVLFILLLLAFIKIVCLCTDFVKRRSRNIRILFIISPFVLPAIVIILFFGFFFFQTSIF